MLNTLINPEYRDSDCMTQTQTEYKDYDFFVKEKLNSIESMIDNNLVLLKKATHLMQKLINNNR